MKNIRNNKGVTLSSLVIYIIAMAIVIGIVATVTTYYYGNIQNITGEVDSSKEYTKLNSYLSQDINNPNNTIKDCKEDRIVFYNSINESYNQYTFKKDSIYFNKIKICTGIKDCKFALDEEDSEYKFNINITFEGEETKTLTYSIKKDVNTMFQ